MLLYSAGLLVAEALTVLTAPRLGLWLHAALLGGLLLLASRESGRQLRRVYLPLTFAPLIRIVSLTAPLVGLPLIYWYILTGIPLAIGVAVVLRLVSLPREELALTVRWSPGQILVGASGLGLGYVEYLILRPAALAPADDALALITAALILIIFTGFLEELIFRGLMQGTAERVVGHRGVVFVALVFTILHLGYQSVLDLVFVFAVALYFGFYVRRTRSIFGVSLAHGLVNVSLFLVFPHWIGPSEVAAVPAFRTATPTATATFAPSPTLTPFMPAAPTATATPVPTATATGTPTPVPSPTPEPYVIDDNTAGFFGHGGEWWSERTGYDGDLHWAFAAASVATAGGEWRPSLSSCGLYDVEAHLPARYATTRSAHYLVSHLDGTTEVVIDQFAHRGTWAELGRFTFDETCDCFVRLTNATGQFTPGLLVAFDAVRWVYLEPCNNR